jgi:hypothetical protein
MRFIALAALFVALTSSAQSQQLGRLGLDENIGAPAGQADRVKIIQSKVPNPFEEKPRGGGYGMMGVGGGDMEGMMGSFEEMEDEEMGMDMVEMGMGMGTGGAASSQDQRFRRGLQRAIQSLQQAKTDSEKETLRGYVRDAFDDRYTKMIASRKGDLERLKRSVAKLESDLKRREAAKERVVQVQMQSVQLAAEGLLELGELQGGFGGTGGSGGGYGDDDYSR